MVNLIKLKRSSTPGAVPSSLEDGELAINRSDGILFWKNAADAIVKAFLGRLRDLALGIRQTTVAPSAGVITIDLSLGNTWLVNLTANVTSVSLTNFPTTGYAQRVVLYFKQDGTGGRTVAGWPAGTKWPASTPPTITPAANAVDSVVLDTFDAGTTIYGTLAAQNYG